MAIYHCSVKTISRGKGQAVLASLAYRIGQNLTCERYGKTFKYENRQNSIEHVDLFLPKSTTDLTFYNHENLWNKVEARETKSNSQLAREIVVAIPAELSEIERIQLVQKQCQWLVEKYGVAVSVALHKPNDLAEKNYHAHIMFTTRSLENNEFGDKIVFKKEQVKELRKVWETLANTALERYDTKIDCRSHNDAQNPKIPTKHEGYFLKNLSEEQRAEYDIIQYNKQARLQHGQLEQIEIGLKQVHKKGNENIVKTKTFDEQIAVSEKLIYELQLKKSELEEQKKQQIELESIDTQRVAAAVVAPQVPSWGSVADVDRLEEITRFNPDLLPKLQAIRDFASYDVTQHLKSKTVTYGIPAFEQDHRFSIPVYDVAGSPQFAITDDFLKNYMKYCESVLNAVTAHYSAKETAFNESFSLNIPKHTLPWLTKQNELSDSRLNEILEPIGAFSLRQKNEVFSAQLEQIKKQQSHITKAFELAEAYVPNTKIDVEQDRASELLNLPESDPRFEPE
ncbi:MobA/MobL family protein [Acinetobacter sp. YH01012]|uniref:MobA/MobL family protein n=1 Tax=Acinetobacter sp. YH01012 TaxID=2601028 RepID=UPI0015D3853C|nr:MobA/MobL family protein [Acinetobacter sp. YH01012]